MVHGEPRAALALRELVEKSLGWRATVAEDGARVSA